MSGEDGGAPRVGRVRYVVSAVLLVIVGVPFGLIVSGQLQPMEIISDSMSPVLERGDRVFIRPAGENSIHYRGKIITMRSPVDDGPPLIKRIAGTPGDTVQVKDGVLYVNDEVFPSTGGLYPEGIISRPLLLGPSMYYVVGENRMNSEDSLEFGPVEESIILGEVAFRYAPLSRFGKVE